MSKPREYFERFQKLEIKSYPVPCKKKKPVVSHREGSWKNQFPQALDSPIWKANKQLGLLLEDLGVLDFDDMSEFRNFKTKFPEMDLCPLQETKKGVHVFFRRDKRWDDNSIYDKSRCLPSLPNVDIKTKCSTGTGGLIMVEPSTDKKWVRSIMDTEPPYMSNNLFDFIATEYHSKTYKYHFDTLKEIVLSLDPSRYNDYEKWRKVGQALANINPDTKNIFIEFSKQSEKFNLDNVETYWDQFVQNRNPNINGIKTLRGYLKTDVSSDLDQLDPIYIASNKIVKFLNGNFLYSNNKWYHFDKRWKSISADDAFARITKAVFKSDLSIKVKNSLLGKYCVKCERYIKRMLLDDSVQFDTNPYLLGMEDGLFDLQLKQFRPAKPEDLISFSTGHTIDTIKAVSQEDKDFLYNEYWSKIYNDEEIREYALNVYSRCLDGLSYGVFIFFIGSGGNCKGTSRRLIMETLGDYASAFDNTVLTREKVSRGSADPTIAKLRGKRYVITSEPSGTIDSKIVNELTGGDVIDCRQLYSGDDSFLPQWTIFVENNTENTFSHIDGGLSRRFRVIRHRGKLFPDHMEEGDYLIENMTNFDTIEWKKKLAPIMLALMIDRHNFDFDLDKEIPDKIKSQADKWLSGACQFSQWLDENIVESTNSKDYITRGNISKKFKKDLRSIMSSKQLAVYNIKEMDKILKRKFGKSYKKTHRNYTNCIVGYNFIWNIIDQVEDESICLI